MPLRPGTRLSLYEIVAPLGAGAMGEVYRARDTRLGREVAIKVLPEAFAADPERRARFEREARALAAVQHPNIAVIYGLEESAGTSYLALELIGGESLSQRLARGALPMAEALEIGAQIAAAIDAAHQRGIVHRDLKPGNIMIAASGGVKVLDFGLAKAGPATTDAGAAHSASPTLTELGMVLGTASYMSPEQASGKAVDRRTDVWALGCVLFECLTGQQAFPGHSTYEVLARVLEREPDWSALPAAAPARLRDLLKRCLTKDPDARPRDAGDLRGELLAIAADLSSGRTASASPAPSLAVLYFQNQSAEPESDYFCDGVTEDIMTDLSKVKGLRVASRSAVTGFRGADAKRVARELGVGAVLEGSVRRAGSRIRLSVQLVSADGFQIWSERFDRTLEDVFKVQDEIASAIAGALKVQLAPAEGARGNKPAEFAAYDLYLKGREQYVRYTAESQREAIRLFEQAIALDPSYALAYAGVGDAYGQLLQWTDDPPEEYVRRGLEAARRAIALDPRLAEGHKAEALVHAYSGNQAAQLAALKRALDADPRYGPALSNLGGYYFRMGDLAGTERAFRRAVEIDPDDVHCVCWLALVLGYTHRLDESTATNDRARQISSAPFYVSLVHMQRASLCVMRHRAGELEQVLRDARQDGVDTPSLDMIEAYFATCTDRMDHAKRLLAKSADSNPPSYGALCFGALATLRAGETDRAIAMMNRRLVLDVAPMLIRMQEMMHPFLDLAPFQPRQSKLELVWPLEAPMIDRTRLGLFRQVRIASGMPAGSNIWENR